MAKASVTFETTTNESIEHGDLADHGWVTPGLHQVSIGGRCKGERAYSKRVRMAQKGRYDWPLGEAVRHFLGEADYVSVEPHMGERGWRVVVRKDRVADDYGEAVGYAVFFPHLSLGTAERLARVFINQGAREVG